MNQPHSSSSDKTFNTPGDVAATKTKPKPNALVIGASGGIATAMIEGLLVDYHVTGVSRSSSSINHEHYAHCQIAFQNEMQIADACRSFTQRFSRVICCIGVLHSEALEIFPEKRMEDLSADSLEEYFRTNVIIPSLWLKHLPSIMARKQRTDIVFLSARVGSISDNKLGGWYGYRSSKAALNMLVKTAQVEIKRRLPECVLSLYHPGTVDTHLSKPFQANVASGKLFTPDFTAQQLLSELVKRGIDDAPHYFDWDGKTIPW